MWTVYVLQSEEMLNVSFEVPASAGSICQNSEKGASFADDSLSAE
jgi:hypothetical protein